MSDHWLDIAWAIERLNIIWTVLSELLYKETQAYSSVKRKAIGSILSSIHILCDSSAQHSLPRKSFLGQDNSSPYPASFYYWKHLCLILKGAVFSICVWSSVTRNVAATSSPQSTVQWMGKSRHWVWIIPLQLWSWCTVICGFDAPFARP